MIKKVNFLEKEKQEKKAFSSFSLKMIKEDNIDYKMGLGQKIITPEIIHRVAIEGLKIHEEPAELFSIFTLNTKNNITGYFEITRGTLNASIVHPRDVFQRALLQNAYSIILLHNHPSGDPAPSDQDITITNKLKEVGKIINIQVLDHIIIGDELNYISFKREGLI